MSVQLLSTSSVLSAFDRWNDGNGAGPAYGKAVLYAAGEISLEELVRAVLLDWDLNPDNWPEYAGVVEEAFEVWMKLTRPYVCEGDELEALETAKERSGAA